MVPHNYLCHHREPTKTSTTPSKTQTRLQSLYVLSKNTYFLWFHTITYVITENQPRLVPPQARPRQCYKVFMFSLVVHTRPVWNQVHMFTGPISVWFWPLPTTLTWMRLLPTSYAVWLWCSSGHWWKGMAKWTCTSPPALPLVPMDNMKTRKTKSRGHVAHS